MLKKHRHLWLLKMLKKHRLPNCFLLQEHPVFERLRNTMPRPPAAGGTMAPFDKSAVAHSLEKSGNLFGNYYINLFKFCFP